MKTLSFQWLLILFLLVSVSFSDRCNPNDKKALLQIKKSLKNPYVLISWDPQTDCCGWNNVECDATTNRIRQLTVLTDNNLSGGIPAAVGDLPYLDTLEFHKLPNLTGHIPAVITKLIHLRYLTLSWTNLSGPVPEFLSELKNLTYLDLSFNNLTGSIPSELSTLPNLVSLHLDRNKLTGSIPESFGKFTGSVPDLYLSHNNLTGSIPKSLGNLNFTRIELARNEFQGDASMLLNGPSKPLEIIDLSRNNFTFDISKVKFPENLIYLDLNHNKIFGSLPSSMIEIDLQFFNVSYNRLCGEIPIGGKMQNFDSYSYFHNRCLCGSPLTSCD